ncbi:Uncharacterised protein [Peptoniphilus harei]|uniref:Uncharacterized protein n=1 Tax=Peptoniphilus harei TaxID=54005 RepID=A0A2X1XNY6_9FIRM|nr:Uncharacterised protein [Peptoniphilus harei]
MNYEENLKNLKEELDRLKNMKYSLRRDLNN